MQDGVLHAVQSRSHFLYCPNGALLRGLLGAVHRNRTFDKNAPLYGILEGCTQQPVHLMDGGAGKEPLLLLFGQFLLLSLDIRTAGRFAQGRIEVFHVVGLELLHLHAADIGDNKVLDGGKVGFVGLGCPLVFLLHCLGSQSIRNSPTVTVDGIRKVPAASSCSICFFRFVASSLVGKLSHLS